NPVELAARLVATSSQQDLDTVRSGGGLRSPNHYMAAENRFPLGIHIRKAVRSHIDRRGLSLLIGLDEDRTHLVAGRSLRFQAAVEPVKGDYRAFNNVDALPQTGLRELRHFSKATGSHSVARDVNGIRR